MDLFAEAAKEVAEADAAEAGEEDDNDEEDAEPEDDFNAAWEVLDLARAIYDKQHDADASNEDVALKLADCYIALGDVSLETGTCQMLHRRHSSTDETVYQKNSIKASPTMRSD